MLPTLLLHTDLMAALVASPTRTSDALLQAEWRRVVSATARVHAVVDRVPKSFHTAAAGPFTRSMPMLLNTNVAPLVITPRKMGKEKPQPMQGRCRGIC